MSRVNILFCDENLNCLTFMIKNKYIYIYMYSNNDEAFYITFSMFVSYSGLSILYLDWKQV